ncbi:MAG: amidophosphoribosyltransferase [Candidatus Thorarchaeota archaeon]
MCGVLGILGNYELTASKELLLLLAHRGQDASGLLWKENEGFGQSKSMGSPSQILVPEETSNFLLGSTRYPTSGRRVCSENDLEDFVAPFQRGEVAITHNGNITNLRQLTEKEYRCDTQFICDRLHNHLSHTEGNLPEAFSRLVDEIDGAYSLVGMYDGILFAFRDSRGIKPLVFGRSETHTVIASESMVLDMAGVGLERDVYPGELLLFGTNQSMQSYAITQHDYHSHCFFEYVYFANPAARIQNQLVYDVRFRLGRALAKSFMKLALEKPDYVVPVPDTSRPAAQALAEELEVPMREIILKNRYLGRTFIAQSQNMRNLMARYKYIYLDDKIRGKTILVVDDSIVRGTTAKMIVADLKQRGARNVYFAVTCPPQKHPCYYGIDISTSSELIASNANQDEIREFVDADALIYQDMDGLINAIGIHDMCLACLDGHYPTEYANKIQRAVKEKEGAEGIRDYERIIE